MIVVWLFLAVLWICLHYVIVVFPDHTHLLLLCPHNISLTPGRILKIVRTCPPYLEAHIATPLKGQGFSENSNVNHAYILICFFTAGYKKPQCFKQYMFWLKTISTLIFIGYTMFCIGYGVHASEQSSRVNGSYIFHNQYNT